MKMNKAVIATFVLASSVGATATGAQETPLRQSQTNDSASQTGSERTQSNRSQPGNVAAGQAAQQRENLQGTPQSAPGSARRINADILKQTAEDFYKNVHIRGSKLVGWNVVDEAGADLGKISDVAIGSGGRIDALVVKVGGIAGIGEKEYAIPWQAISVQSTKDPLRVMVSRAEVERATPIEGDPLGGSLTFKDQQLNERFDVEGSSAKLAGTGPGTGTATVISPAKTMDEQAHRAKFNQYDRNNDGYISQGEARSDRSLNGAFGRLDNNRDRRLDESEFSRFEVADSAGGTQSGSGARGGREADDGMRSTSDANPGTNAVPHSQESPDPRIHGSGSGAK